MSTELQKAGESHKFVRDIIWVALSQILTSVTGIVTLPLLTKTYSSEVYGIWTQVNVTVGLLVIVATLQFVTAVVRFLAGQEDKAKRRQALGTMLYAILIFTGFILLVGNVWASQISLFLFDNPTYGAFVRLAFVWACAEALFTFFISHLRARGKIKKLSIIQVALAALKMALMLVLVLSGSTMMWVIASMVIVDLIFVLWVLFIIVREDGFPVPTFVGLGEFLAFSLPQIPVNILAWVMSLSDRYFITHFAGLSETGIYATSSSLAGLIAMFYNPIGYVLFPAVSKTWEQGRKSETRAYFESSTRIFLTLAIPGAVGLAMISQAMLKVLATSEYLAGMRLVLLIGISQVFMGLYVINEYIVYLVKQTKWLPIMTVASAGISLALNFVLIPYLGITGAAISKIIAYFVLALTVTVWVKKAIDYNIDLRYLGKVTAASLIMAGCLYFLKGSGVIHIMVAMLVAVATFGAALFVLRAFSTEDKLAIKRVSSGIVPWLNRKKRR